MENWDKYIDEVASLIEHREGYQKSLGKIALEIRKLFGMQSLKTLSEDIKERHGLTISPSTLHNYSWVEEKLGGYDIPEDIPYRLRQLLASNEDREKWIKKIMEGASSKEIYDAIKGPRPPMIVDCPACGHEFEVK